MRLFDTGTERPEPVRPARPPRLSVYLASPERPDRTGADDLRAALVADLIRRAGEWHRLVVTIWQRDPGGDQAAAAAFRAACDDLNIYPAEASGRPPEPLDLGVSADGTPPPEPGRWLAPAPVAAGGVLPADLSARGLDPLAFRLALLRHHHREPVPLTWDDLTDVDGALRGWRRQAADWAESPSKPMCAQYVTDVTGAFDDDLDTPGALTALDALAADDEIPPGSKFEAFAYLDRLLGLDLARDIGR